MGTATSVDGTAIAFDRFGEGPPIIMVVGAFKDRSTIEPLARALEQRFTVFNYDRRGRGDSRDTDPYVVDREIEDRDALIVEAGGSASVFGYSSGTVLALRAAASGLAITKRALYEPPFRADDSYPALHPIWPSSSPSSSRPVDEAMPWSCTRQRRWAFLRNSSRSCVTRLSAPIWRRSHTHSSTTRRSLATCQCRPSLSRQP
jgi:pimeloyl-ACP methyl ester carboxylesterase